MRKTLWETFFGAYFSATRIPWRIYGNHSHKLLCADYGSLKDNDALDDLEVFQTIIKVRRGINGFKYSACDANGYFIGNFEKLAEVRKHWLREIK